MGLPASGIIKASDINIEAARVGTTNAPLGIQTGTAGEGSLVKLYDDATPSPVDQNSPYAYSDFYGKSYTPPVISCGTSTAAIGQGSGTGYFEAQLDFSTTTGAIVVYFYVSSVPDGVSFLYNSVTYNTLTSNAEGRITAASGTNNIVGATGSEAALIAGSPWDDITKSVWNGTSFGATGNTESGLIAAATNINLGASGLTYTLVIPKTAASPSDGVLKIFGNPVSTTAWRVNAPCPITLPSFTTNSVNATFQGACCATQNQTYYYVKNASLGTSSTFTIDANTSNLPEVNYFVFSDSTGATALANGYYKITSNTAIYVQNGVVDSISTGCGSCTSVIGPISASGRESSSQFVCFNSGTTQYWYEGTAGTLPGLGDKCYDTSSVPGTVLVAGWYRKGTDTSDGRMQIDSTGVIITDEAC